MTAVAIVAGLGGFLALAAWAVHEWRAAPMCGCNQPDCGGGCRPLEHFEPGEIVDTDRFA